MLSNCYRMALPIRIILVITILAILLTDGFKVHANGSHPGAQEVFSDTTSRFPIRVLMVPSVGNGHMNILLDSNNANVNTDEIQIFITAQNPIGNFSGQNPIQATPAFGSPGWYGVNLPINEPGQWGFTIEITDGESRTLNNFRVDIMSNSDINWPIVFALFIFTLIFIWAIISRLRRKQLRRYNYD